MLLQPSPLKLTFSLVLLLKCLHACRCLIAGVSFLESFSLWKSMLNLHDHGYIWYQPVHVVCLCIVMSKNQYYIMHIYIGPFIHAHPIYVTYSHFFDFRFQAERKKLPIYAYRDELLEAVDKYQAWLLLPFQSFFPILYYASSDFRFLRNEFHLCCQRTVFCLSLIPLSF